jgi:sugar lactone lactonase YvrE
VNPPASGLSSLTGIVSAGPGLFYIADTGRSTIDKFDPTTLAATVWAGTSGVTGTSDGAGTAAQFNNPTGLAVDGSGDVYVADTASSTIRKISAAGAVTTLAGVPGEPGSTDGVSTAAHFNYPQGVAVDSSGNVYVADTGNSTIRQISPSGSVTTLAGTAGSPGSADGTGAAASFGKPVAIVIDSSGNLFVEDYGAQNLLIRKIAAGAVVTTPVSLPWNSSMGTGSSNLAIDSSNLLYLVTYNPLVGPPATLTVASASGVISSTGLLSSYGFEQFSSVPTGMAFDQSGDMFATEGSSIFEGTYATGPAITLQPQITISEVDLAYPQTETFAIISVAADSLPGGVLTYQWLLNGNPAPLSYVPGYFYVPQPDSYVTLINPETVGTYTVLITDSYLGGSIMSDGVALSPASGIVFNSQPQSRTVVVGQDVSLSVSMGGTFSPTNQWFPTYQWTFNGAPIPDATGDYYQITNAQVSESGSYAVTVTGQGVSVTSQTAVLTVEPPFTLAGQPASQAVGAGASATFSVTATGTLAPSYQWTLNGAPIVGATAPSYTVSDAQAPSSGAYAVTVTDQGSAVTSQSAFLTVTASSGGPVIGTQPQSYTTYPRGTVVLTVALSSSQAQASAAHTATDAASAVAYQWYFNGSALADGGGISGSQTAALVLSGAATQAGTYVCLIEDSAGSVLSQPSTLAVSAVTDIGRLIDVSCRAQAGRGADILIAGFVVGGSGASGSQSLLVRASGPALAPFDVAGTLPDPELQLYSTSSGSSLVATNTGWAGNSEISSAAAAVGAFPWVDSASHDAALLETLTPGPYTANVTGEAGDSGVALAEVYDATPGGSYTLATPRLVNISARVQVGTGGNTLIAGFVIGGSTSKTVLIRASGPALGPFGITGALPDPQLSLFQGNSGGTSTLLQSNTGWGGDAQIAAIAASVGAFSWGASATPDSALLVTLPPGAYTAQVSGASGDTGVALVEVYEVQ